MDQDPDKLGGAYHRPVLAHEVTRLLAPTMPGVVIDATLGGGGHSRRLLREFGEDVTVVGIDRDPEALANARDLGVAVVEGNFADLAACVAPHLNEAPAAAIFDFGVSSRQLDDAERGFSYRRDGPLDMRMGPDAATTAADVVNTWPERELAEIIRRYGEEPLAGRIAGAVAAARPLDSTGRLAAVVAAATPASRRRGGHPARRTFQAIRIAVNGELDAVVKGVDQAIGLVRPHGRVLAIAYHSLEDRIVKRRFAGGARGCNCPVGLPVCGCGASAELKVLTKRPIRPSAEEIEMNGRARSATLRAAERLAA